MIKEHSRLYHEMGVSDKDIFVFDILGSFLLFVAPKNNLERVTHTQLSSCD